MSAALLLASALMVNVDAPPLASSAPKGTTESFVGQLRVADFELYLGGCTEPATHVTWAVLERDGASFPLKSITPTEAMDLRRVPARGRDLTAPFWTKVDLANRGLADGDRVKVTGLAVPLGQSGTEAVQPIYGLALWGIERMGPLSAALAPQVDPPKPGPVQMRPVAPAPRLSLAGQYAELRRLYRVAGMDPAAVDEMVDKIEAAQRDVSPERLAPLLDEMISKLRAAVEKR